MSPINIRTTKPGAGNNYYITESSGGWSGCIEGSPVDSDCNVLANCVGYAVGRFNEIGNYGYCKYYKYGPNAGNFIDYIESSNPNVTPKLTYGQEPKQGAIMVWKKTNGAGHVAIVEKVNSSTEVFTSESAYGGDAFYNSTRSKGGGNWGSGSEYSFQGFIYNPAVTGSQIQIPTTYYSGNYYLSQSQMENNALYLYSLLSNKGWTLNAIAGVLGNMETESTINPGIWEGLNEGNLDGGYGLVQWTPATKFIDWANNLGLSISSMESAVERLMYELEEGLQYYETDSYPISFSEFIKSTASPTYLANAFLYNYERPEVTPQPARGEQAERWFAFLSGVTPTPPSTKKKMSIIFYLNRKR